MQRGRVNGAQGQRLADDCHLGVVVQREGEFAVGRGKGEWFAGGALLTAHLIIGGGVMMAR